MDLRWILVRSAFWGPVCFYIVNSGPLGLQSEALSQKGAKEQTKVRSWVWWQTLRVSPL